MFNINTALYSEESLQQAGFVQDNTPYISSTSGIQYTFTAYRDTKSQVVYMPVTLQDGVKFRTFYFPASGVNDKSAGLIEWGRQNSNHIKMFPDRSNQAVMSFLPGMAKIEKSIVAPSWCSDMLLTLEMELSKPHGQPMTLVMDEILKDGNIQYARSQKALQGLLDLTSPQVIEALKVNKQSDFDAYYSVLRQLARMKTEATALQTQYKGVGQESIPPEVITRFNQLSAAYASLRSKGTQMELKLDSSPAITGKDFYQRFPQLVIAKRLEFPNGRIVNVVGRPICINTLSKMIRLKPSTAPVAATIQPALQLTKSRTGFAEFEVGQGGTTVKKAAPGATQTNRIDQFLNTKTSVLSAKTRMDSLLDALRNQQASGFRNWDTKFLNLSTSQMVKPDGKISWPSVNMIPGTTQKMRLAIAREDLAEILHGSRTYALTEKDIDITNRLFEYVEQKIYSERGTTTTNAETSPSALTSRTAAKLPLIKRPGLSISPTPTVQRRLMQGVMLVDVPLQPGTRCIASLSAIAEKK